MVPVGYVVGIVAALPVVALPGSTAGIAYPTAILAVVGITHLDGLADLADAGVVHGSVGDRRAVMQDTVTGVGGTVATGLSVIGLALAGVALASAPPLLALGVVVAAEVGAKLAMVGVAAFGKPAYEGMGSQLVGSSPSQWLAGVVMAVPAAVIAWPALPPVITLVGAITGGALTAWSASSLLDGVSGDVFGAANEVARLVGLHAGVITWMHC